MSVADQTETRLHITGMSCASCVGRMQRALADMPGVAVADVNLATESATVRHGAEVTAEDLVRKVEDTGYHATVAEVTLAVEGMTCASCVLRVETALKAVPGVTDARVNLANETAKVSYLDGATDAARLAQAVGATGYKAHAIDAQSHDHGAAKAAEAETLKRNMLIAAVLTAPVFAIEMGSHFIPGVHELIHATIGMQASRVLQFVLTTLVLAWPGRQFYRIGFKTLARLNPDMNALVAIGTAAAWGFSTVATFAPGVLPAGTANVYFEAAAVIVVLILLGRWLEARAKGRTGQAIARLVGLQPKTALVQRDGSYREIAVTEIVVGDVIRTRPGERIAVDGVVAEGATYVDESMISGEPVPVAKAGGDEVIAGTINGNGTLTYRATRVGADTVLSQIIRMVEAAQGAKLPVQGLVDRITAVFVPVVIGTALLTIVVWLLFGPDPALGLALVAGVSVLIIACPCAMGLATPTSIMVGTGRAADLGVLFRKGDALQALQAVRTVAVDKTGTLTQGRPELTDIDIAKGFSEDDVLARVAAVEALSEHPIAQAIARAAQARGLKLPVVKDFEAITGFGVRATVGGKALLIGADRLMRREGLALEALNVAAERFGRDGKTPLYAAIDGRIAAAIAVADPIKPGTPQAIAALHALGLKVAMITGDNAETAAAIARRLGIDEVRAEVLPEGKVAALEDLAHPVAFVGDGINDAPALAASDVGIAIGTGTDVAIEAADVVLMSGDLRGVVNAFAVSRATMRNIRQNLGWAFGYNAALIPVAAGVLYPATGMLLSPMLAAGAMALSSVFVLSNALRLRRVAAPIPPDKPGNATPVSAAQRLAAE